MTSTPLGPDSYSDILGHALNMFVFCIVACVLHSQSVGAAQCDVCNMEFLRTPPRRN